MSSTTLQQLKEMGESMGLKGSALTDFIKEQQAIEREEREKARQFELEKEQAREKQELAREKERKFELEMREKERKHEFEMKEKERQYEAEKERAKEKEKQAELEHAKLLAEQEHEKHRDELEKMEKQLEFQERAAGVDQSQRTSLNISTDGTCTYERSIGKIPKMPYFDEDRDFMDSYLERFERFARTQKWRPDNWALYLSALLKGKALDVYSMMPTELANDYDQLKDALLKRYQLSADGFKKRFRTAKPESGETPIQFLTRIENYLLRWIELAKAEKSFDGLKMLIVQEQYLSTCPKEMAMHLKERKPHTIKDLGEVAENYIEAHSTDIVFGIDPRQHRVRNLQSDTRCCYNCGGKG